VSKVVMLISTIGRLGIDKYPNAFRYDSENY